MASHERRASSKGIRQQRDMEPAIDIRVRASTLQEAGRAASLRTASLHDTANSELRKTGTLPGGPSSSDHGQIRQTPAQVMASKEHPP